jgi:hypothetical protein
MRLRRCANECLVFRESYDNGIQTHSSAFIGVTFFMSGRWLSVVMLWILPIKAFSSFYLHYILIVNVTREEYCWNNASLTLNNEWINFKLGEAICRTRHHPFNSLLVRRTSFVTRVTRRAPLVEKEIFTLPEQFVGFVQHYLYFLWSVFSIIGRETKHFRCVHLCFSYVAVQHGLVA